MRGASHPKIVTFVLLCFSYPLLRSIISTNNSYFSDLSDTQKEVQSLALKFAKEEILPHAHKHDESGEFPWDIVKKAHSLGLMNPQIPEKYGKRH